jgi:hypothetical protein
MVYSTHRILNHLDAKARCDQPTTRRPSAWAAAHAVADEVEVPHREVGLIQF